MIFHLIINQVIFKYELRDLCKSFILCICCCSNKRKLKRTSKVAQKEKFLDQGMRKIEKDLDIVNYIKMIKMYRLIKQVLFDKS